MIVLIVGLGSIARKHISAIRKIREVDLYALRSSEKAEEEEGIRNLFSFEEIEEIDFDFFLISNITSKHADTIEKLVRYKKPLFIEKPLFDGINAHYKNLVTTIKENNITTYVACSLRFLESLVEVKKIVANTRINEVNAYSGSYLPNWRPGVNYKNTYSANKEMGGGVHIDLIHELDYLYWIFGAPEDTRHYFSSRSSLEINAVDYANYLWLYRNFPASVMLNYYRLDSKRTLEIVTDKGTFLVDLINNRIWQDGTEVFSSEQTLLDTFTAQMEFFLTEILNGRNKDFNSVEEAYKILKLCLKE